MSDGIADKNKSKGSGRADLSDGKQQTPNNDGHNDKPVSKLNLDAQQHDRLNNHVKRSSKSPFDEVYESLRARPQLMGTDQPGKGGLTGTLTSPDGKNIYTVVNGDLFDGNNHSIGHLTADGKVKLPKEPCPKPGTGASFVGLTGLLNGWHFNGTEGGQKRTFAIAGDMSYGRLFLPDEKSGKNFECEIRFGMIINKQTGKQIGEFRPPTEGADGKLNGGSIRLTNSHSAKEIALANLGKTVFDVQLADQVGMRTKALQGLCLGPGEKMADGTVKTGTGGIVNLQETINKQFHASAALEAKRKECEGHNALQRLYDDFSGNTAKSNNEQRDAAAALKSQKDLASVLSTGQVDTAMLARIKGIETSLKSADNIDPLKRERARLDSNEHTLEPLPADTRCLNGTVGIPLKWTGGGQISLFVKNGKLIGADGKTAIGTIDGPTGDMTLFNGPGKNPTHMNMSNLVGATWHLQFADANGKPQKLDWISLGSHGLASVQDLRAQAKAEVDYAREYDRKTHTTDSANAVQRSSQLEAQFNKRLNGISINGVTANDINYLTEGPSKHVKAELFKEKHDTDSPKIEVPRLASKADVQAIQSGSLRIGNRTFEIANGNLKVGNSVVGQLGPGYVVNLKGEPPINLASENYVLLKFRLRNEQNEHQILGLGRSKTIESFGSKEFVEGGLVDVKELYRQAKECSDQAHAGNDAYFNNRPVVTASAANWAMGDREAVLNSFASSIDRQSKDLHNRMDKLFSDGFDAAKVNNNSINGNIKVTQTLMSSIGSRTGDVTQLAQEGQELQKQFNDAVVMSAITVGTMGVGGAVSGAVATARMSMVAGAAANIGGSAAAGALISAGLRHTQRGGWDEAARNARSGAFEGATIASGMAGGQQFANLPR